MKRLLFVDLESTGRDPWKDRIVEAAFSAVELNDGDPSRPVSWSFLVNPGCPIPPEVTEIHGITDADVADAQPFSERAAAVQEYVDGAVIVGYNVRTFDSILLDRELRLAGQRGLLRGDPAKPDKITHPEIDLLQLWHRFEPRTLHGALQRFLGYVPDDLRAHDAKDDVGCLPKLLEAMGSLPGWPLALEEYENELEALCAHSVPEGEVDRGGKFKRRADGVVVLDFSKDKGTPAARVPISFYEWMLKNDFPEDSKQIARHYIELARRVRT